MNKSFIVKSLSAVAVTSFLLSAVTYSIVRDSRPVAIDLSAFKNAANNINYITHNNKLKPPEAVADLTGSIVKTIEKEIKRKILNARYAYKAKLKLNPFIKESVIAKNWNDIKPVFKDVNLNKNNEIMLSAIVSTASESLGYEINNNDLIKLYSFEVSDLQYNSFANIQIPEVELLSAEVNEDAVQVTQASTSTQVIDEVAPATEPQVESAQIEKELPEVATVANPINDDLVVYDYSADKKNQDTTLDDKTSKKMFDAPLSNSVKEAIAREVGRSAPVAKNSILPKRNTVINEVALDKVMEDEDNLVFDYSKQTAKAADFKKANTASSVSAFMTSDKLESVNQVEFIIKAKEINLNTHKARQSFGFEFVPDYDRSERVDDQTSGEIKLGYSLSGDVSTQTGVIQAQGMISTRVELNLLNKGIEVPLFNEEGIQKFLENKKTEVMGNLILVARDESISDIEIDSDYQFKIFLSNKFKLVESQTDASYVLFLGLKTGNVALRYLLSNKESAQKIVYVGEGELYFEDPDFIKTEREIYTFTTRSLLGRKVKELNIDGSDITFFGTKTFAKKKALNAYEIKVPELVDSSRKYLDFKHLGNSLFVGTSSTTEIEIPGKDFIGKVLEANDMSEIGSRCLVQINLTKDIREIKASGKNKSGEMFTETTYLDKDGNFSRDNLELSEKVFVAGDMEGLFNIRLEYTDGTTDFLKTFCSEGSYLVEQL